MLIPSGVIIIWTGTHAGIPTGWSRVTGLDGRYVKGTAAATNPNVTGGNATHTHTASAAHNHTISAHTHTITANTMTGGASTGSSNKGSIDISHSHTATSGAVASASVQSVTPNYSSQSNDPPYYEVIFIQSDGTPNGVPDQGVVFFGTSSIPANFYQCEGNNSTPNLSDKYLKGAGANNNAGGTGGSTTNNHTTGHNHTTSHNHASATSTGPTGSGHNQSGGSALANNSHTHSLATVAYNATNSNEDDIMNQSETVEPSYKKLLAIQNRKGSNNIALGLIAMWTGTLASIPTGWVLCDGNNSTPDMRGYFAKVAATTGVIGNTGGSNTHSHANQTHTHDAITHGHNGGTVSHGGAYNSSGTSGSFSTRTSDAHSITTNDISMSFDSVNVASSTDDNQPPFTTVAFIQCTIANTDYTKLFEEIASLTESFKRATTKLLSSTITLTETIRRTVTRTLSSTISLTETMTNIRGYGKIFSDIVTLTETIQRAVTRTVSSTVSLTENLSRGITRALSETVTNVDMTIRKGITRTISSVLTISEEMIRIQGKLLSSTVSLTEDFTKLATKYREMVDNIYLTEIIERIFDKFGRTFEWINALFGDHTPRATTTIDTPTTDNDMNKPLMSSSNEKPDGFIVEQDRPSL